ncbi:hypothetical protein E5E53_03785 [Helicobacter pylori]|nr:hypothetical protein E5E53_03785 [Helicobacter pylori]
MKKYREKNSNIANSAIVGAVSEESALYARELSHEKISRKKQQYRQFRYRWGSQ